MGCGASSAESPASSRQQEVSGSAKKEHNESRKQNELPRGDEERVVAHRSPPPSPLPFDFSKPNGSYLSFDAEASGIVPPAKAGSPVGTPKPPPPLHPHAQSNSPRPAPLTTFRAENTPPSTLKESNSRSYKSIIHGEGSSMLSKESLSSHVAMLRGSAGGNVSDRMTTEESTSSARVSTWLQAVDSAGPVPIVVPTLDDGD